MREKVILIILFLFSSVNISFSESKLTFSSHPEVAPMSWNYNDKLIGVGPELVKLIFNELGISVEAQLLPWKRTLLNAKTGELDVVANIYFTKERTEFLEYCIPHYSEAKTVVIVKEGYEFPFFEWKDLINLKGGTLLGDSWGEEFDNYMDENLDISRVREFSTNLRRLDSGRIDYIIASNHNANMKISKLGFSEKITILPVAINTEKEYIAISKKSPYLKYLPQVNKKIEEMLADGRIEKLINKYIEQAEFMNMKK